MQISVKNKYAFAVTAAMLCAAAGSGLPAPAAQADSAVLLSTLDLSKATQGWGTPQADKSVGGHALTLAGRTFARGFGTHAPGLLLVHLDGGARRFRATVGVDDEVGGGRGSVEFEVLGGQGQILWRSGVLRQGQTPKAVDVDIAGMQQITLRVSDGGDGLAYDHADWADAQFAVSGAAPFAVAPPVRAPYILTPPHTPRINGARIYGERPGRPFLYTVPATGDDPITFTASGLPHGLALDKRTGRITGTVTQAGVYRVQLTATNARGRDTKPLAIEIGSRIALTPPMGWNTYNALGVGVTQAQVLAQARALVSSGLNKHGWTYVNIDDAWQGARTGPDHAMQANADYPDMRGICDTVHALGLKAGLYSTPWVTTYGSNPGASSENPAGAWSPPTTPADFSGHVFPWAIGPYHFEAQDARQYAAWGFDYLKYDWFPNGVPETARMADALQASGRDLVFSLSNAAPFEHAADWARLSNAWRITGDIRDTWASLLQNGFAQDKWMPFGGPGHWNDSDMLVVGVTGGWAGGGASRPGPNDLHPSRLTPDEQYTHISLWCLMASPLLLGCDLTKLDAFTLNLLTNDEVLAVDQDAGGHAARLAHRDEAAQTEVWARPLADGTLAVGLFNLSDNDGTVRASWADLHIAGTQPVRDLWRQKNRGRAANQVQAQVPSHGVVLLKVGTPRPSTAGE